MMQHISRGGIYIGLLAALLLSSCKKEQPTPLESLPAETQVGAGTFGCLLNGQAWVSIHREDSFRLPSLYYSPSGTVPNFAIHGAKSVILRGGGSNYQSIIFDGDSIKGLGTYAFDQENGPLRFRWEDEFGRDLSYYNDTTSQASGSLTIKFLDRGRGVMAGTFELTASKPGYDTLVITHGRFDLRF